MRISITMPVYNAAHYVEEAIKSVLAQPETAELIIVDDCSTDGSLALCQGMAEQDSRIRVLAHPGGTNRGLAASRNLCVANAGCDYVAFLDADDYYLSGRFTTAKRIFADHPDADGVCDSVGLLFEDEETRARYGDPDRTLHAMPKQFEPEGLLELLIDNKGWFHFNGIVVKRALFERTGPFCEASRTASDLGMELKMAASGRLFPGSLDKPVAMRRMYPTSITARTTRAADLEDNKMVFNEVWEWARQRDLPPTQRALLFLATCWCDAIVYSDRKALARYLAKIASFVANGVHNPSILYSGALWRLLARRTARKVGFQSRSDK